MTNIPASSETDPPLLSSDILMAVIVNLLAPIFLGIAGGDISLARIATFETLSDYRARNHAGLIAAAQIVAFGLAALGSLSLSMADDISLSLALRLRANAVALNRSTEQNRKALLNSHADDPVQHAEPEPAAAFADADTRPDANTLLSPAAEQLLAAESEARLAITPKPARPPAPATAPASTAVTNTPPATAPATKTRPTNSPAAAPTNLRPASTPVPNPLQAAAPATTALPAGTPPAGTPPADSPASTPAAALPANMQISEKRYQAMLAIAMVADAGEIHAGIKHLPPEQRQAATMRAALLSGSAHDLIYGANLPLARPAAATASTPPPASPAPPPT